ncbi:MAG: FtsQ-type POTRA domain-containing protein [Myxococcota bacterium]
MSLLPRIGTSTVVRALLLGAFVVGVGGVLAAVRPDLMLVEHVRFEGLDQARWAELRHLSDIRNGDRIWEVDPDRIARGVERHPWVRRATVRRQLPDTVVVHVEEHHPVALLHMGELYYVGADGSIFLTARNDDLDYPSITGITPELEKQHPALPRLVVRDALALIDALDSRGLVHRDRIHEVQFAPTRGFTVWAGEARILFGLSNTDEQLDRLATLLSHGRVDLSRPLHVDLGPKSLAIVRALDPAAEG